MIKQALLKLFGKDIKTEQPPLTEIGWEASALYRMSDFGKYAPDDLLTAKGYGIYSKMMRDDQVKPCMQFKQNAVISRKWHFECDDENEQHFEIADVFEHIVKVMDGNFKDALKGILSGLRNGFSISEKIYQPIEYMKKTYWGLKALKLRPFQSFDGGFKVDEHGNIEEIAQVQGTDRTKIPLDKIIHFVHQPDVDMHYGESDLRAAYRPWWSKDINIKLWNIYLERLAGGFVKAQITSGTLTASQRTDLESVLNNITSRTGMIIPSNINLDVINPQRAESFEKALVAHDKAIAKSLLVPNLLGLSEQGDTGSYSQSQTQLDAFFWILDEISGRLEEVLNEQLFRELAWWNFATNDFPWFRFEPISDEKKIELAKAWNELVKGNSVTKTDADEAYIRNLMGFPDKPEEEEEDVEDDVVGDLPPEDMPIEMPEQEGWIDALPDEQKEMIKKSFAERPWLKRVNFAQIESTLDKQDDAFVNDMREILAGVRVKLEKDIARVCGDRSFGNVKPKEIENIRMTSTAISKLRKAINDNLLQVLNAGYDLASKELPRRKFRILMGMDKTQTERFLASKAMKIAGVIDQAVLTGVQRVLENAIKYDKTLRQTIIDMGNDTNILELLPEVDAAGRAVNVPARLRNIARTNTADAINQARDALFKSPELRGFVQAYEYSAILDDRTTEICEHLNGKILRDFGIYTPPNHYQCRSVLAPVTVVDEWDGVESSKPRLEPQKGFG